MLDSEGNSNMGKETSKSIRSGGRTTLRVIGFFVCLLVLLLLASRFFLEITGAEARHGYRSRNTVYWDLEQEQRNCLDLLVLGNSEAFASFSPMELWLGSGIPSYLASIPGETMVEMNSILHAALRRQHPKALLIETHALFTDLEPGKADEQLLQQAGQNAFQIFRLHNLWKDAIEKPKNKRRVWKGFRMMPTIRPPKQLDDYMKPDDGTEPIDPQNVRILKKIKKICERRGMALLLYSAPSPKNYNMKRHNTLALLAEELGVPYTDLNLMTGEVGIDWKTDSLDGGDHLNLSGARKTTAYLQRVLQEEVPALSDRRSDPDYSGWNRLAARYQKRENRVLAKMRERAAAQGLTP